MKLRTLGAATLVAALAAGTLLPTGVFAAQDRNSTGTITYEQGDGGDPGNVTDPEEGEDIEEPEKNPNTDPLMIIGATSYEFVDENGSNKVDVVEDEVIYNAAPFEKVVNGAGTGEFSRHFVEFRDIRATEEVYASRQYSISAAMTSPFTSTTGSNKIVLNGAELLYDNVNFVSQPGTDYQTGIAGDDYQINTTPAALTPGSDDGLTPGDSVPFLSVDAEGSTGAGRFHLVFGDTVPVDSDENVRLRVPAGQIITNGEYSATVTWTIADTPTDIPTPGEEGGGTETGGEEVGA